MGHENVGRIYRVGTIAAKRWGLREGDRVALEEYLPCGHCSLCRSGEFRLCDQTEARRPGALRYGTTPISEKPGLWGGYSQFQYLHPDSVFHKVPDEVPAELAAMCLPIGNGIQWTYLDGRAGPGKTVLIQGPGQQGLACVLARRKQAASPLCDRQVGEPRLGTRLAMAEGVRRGPRGRRRKRRSSKIACDLLPMAVGSIFPLTLRADRTRSSRPCG